MRPHTLKIADVGAEGYDELPPHTRTGVGETGGRRARFSELDSTVWKKAEDLVLASKRIALSELDELTRVLAIKHDEGKQVRLDGRPG